MTADIIGHCWHCGTELTRADYGRENHCLSCGKATRACRNCRLYQRGRPNDCLEPLAESIADKVRANFCEHFDPAPRPSASPISSNTQDEDHLRQAAESLFK
ncbi:hypothetical protein CKO42_00220 [Lamprobacter modestohalophilus]|uniref:Uncharacterized protein n=1 Tax=Lamprobacter modestohalophilus TaxID=1064514 RepID=A0A9X0W4N2_9GAMM|nr:hypothetical protein [Lamprobacter modestohalophilus]MBK1616902.1 hypothetical protein [Lamprobacter modestohalophilus]